MGGTDDRHTEVSPARRRRPVCARVAGRVGNQLSEVNSFAAQRSVLIKVGEQEEVLDEVVHAAGLLAHAAHHVVERGLPLEPTFLVELEVAADRGQWGSQFVRKSGKELVFELTRAFGQVTCCMFTLEQSFSLGV